jgi:hypothetical protein
MTSRYAVPGAGAALSLALLGGCGQGTDPPADGGFTSGPDRASVVVRTHLSPGAHGEMFTEGAVPEIRLVDADGHELSPEQDHRDTAIFRDVAPGGYRLVAVLRPCDGNCGTLDGPTGRCEKHVRVGPADTFDVRWRVGRPCRVG